MKRNPLTGNWEHNHTKPKEGAAPAPQTKKPPVEKTPAKAKEAPKKGR